MNSNDTCPNGHGHFVFNTISDIVKVESVSATSRRSILAPADSTTLAYPDSTELHRLDTTRDETMTNTNALCDEEVTKAPINSRRVWETKPHRSEFISANRYTLSTNTNTSGISPFKIGHIKHSQPNENHSDTPSSDIDPSQRGIDGCGVSTHIGSNATSEQDKIPCVYLH